MKRLKISAGGQVSVPATVRQRWKTSVVVAEDCGDHLVLRPAVEDPVAWAWGAFQDSSGPSPEEMKRLDLAEESRAEDREYGASPA